MEADDATRLSLKTELLQQIEVLGQKQSLFPSQNKPIDKIVQQLEDINPISYPLYGDRLLTLVGDWQLIYASRGTVVTAKNGSVLNLLFSFKALNLTHSVCN